jgi:dTDP-4-dehydrorhamnose reductase
LIASLGVHKVRYPVIWERIAPTGSLDAADWSWTDDRLSRLRAHGIVPILGLVHHGSGPMNTSLLDPAFAEGLARFAEMCALRYPWLECVTPVNEPLTTARFSGLYGHWYPHHRDNRSFVRALLHECAAVRAAMQAVRRVNPAAMLMQTEDLGYAHGSECLRYQLDFENERRWLTWDLLCGRVNPTHALYDYLLHSGAREWELESFAADPCPPDLLGIDYYVTSERYLDASVGDYPVGCRGGNGRDEYVDLEVARARPELRRGLTALLLDAWARYRIPIVVSEAHLSCDDEEQRVRWLVELWNDALEARARGCDIRAVTAWALFGATGWDALSTRVGGHYDPGAFDAPRGVAGQPRETAVARAIRMLARRGYCDAPAEASRGWWQPQARLPSTDAAASTSNLAADCA